MRMIHRIPSDIIPHASRRLALGDEINAKFAVGGFKWYRAVPAMLKTKACLKDYLGETTRSRELSLPSVLSRLITKPRLQDDEVRNFRGSDRLLIANR